MKVQVLKERKRIQPCIKCAFAFIAMVAACTIWVCGVFHPTVYADVPAATDFGLDNTRHAWTGMKHQKAMFLTLYEDGRHQLEFRKIQGDAVVLFSSGHPSWRLNHELMWYIQMPVYVREIHSKYGQTTDTV